MCDVRREAGRPHERMRVLTAHPVDERDAGRADKVERPERLAQLVGVGDLGVWQLHLEPRD